VTTRPVDPVTADHGRLRASDADRDRVIETLKVAFTQGRLTRDELDLRAGRALLARTYADLAAATADIPARPAPVALRPRADWPPPALAAPAWDRRPANHWAFKLALGLTTVMLPVMITAALRDRSQDLFSASIVVLMAYVMAVVIAAANVVAARFDDGQRRPR
jgi:hypothetical protein